MRTKLLSVTEMIDPSSQMTRTETGANGKMHGSVVRSLGGSILGGEYRPGEAFPGEAELSINFGVSRTTIREAVKVLSAKGLIESRPRVGIRVRMQEDWRLLDPDVLSWHPNLRADHQFRDSLVESRRVMEPAAARAAAQRATAQDLAAIEAAFLAMERAVPHDMLACNEADVQFHRAIMNASHNIVFKALAGTIEAALRAAFFVTSEFMDADVMNAHKHILERIRMRDPDGAHHAMLHLLDIAAEDLNA
jgi:DNA-binding FadR family transcriptional regulator